jgi:hypothetical protein
VSARASQGLKPAGVFKVFPEFTRLELGHRAAYEQYVQDIPPIGDVQFFSLMTWWDTLDGVRVATLNGNLVVQYWRPGDEKHSGLSLIGNKKIDESLCTIFDHLREQGQSVKLVNVPELVINAIEYPDLYNFYADRLYDEYVMPVASFYPLDNLKGVRRRRAERLLNKYGDSLRVEEIDLAKQENRDLLVSAGRAWWWKNINNFGRIGLESMCKLIDNHDTFGIRNICVFAGDELLGYCLFRQTSDKTCAIVPHVRATHSSTIGFELVGYLLGKWFDEHGVNRCNLTQDWGSPRLRMFMMTLGPTSYFHKYTIEPVGEI